MIRPMLWALSGLVALLVGFLLIALDPQAASATEFVASFLLVSAGAGALTWAVGL